MVNEHVTGFVVGPMMVIANAIQIGLTIYNIHEEDKAWKKVITDLENLYNDLVRYRAGLLEVSNAQQ